MKKLLLCLIVVFSLFWVNSIFANTAVKVERIPCGEPGQTASFQVALENPSSVELGGFDILLCLDSSLYFQSAEAGQLLNDCGWEYFTWQSFSGDCIRLVSIADMNNGPYHPDCWADSSGVLAELDVLVANDPTLSDQFLPVQFMWYDCGDNTLSSRDGYILYISSDVYDWNGGVETVITADSSFPTGCGAPNSCGSGSGAVRATDYYNGGILLVELDTLPPVAICPSDTITANSPGQCDAIVEFVASVEDDSPGATISCDPPSGSIFDVGATQVMCVAVDGAGHTDTCGFNVTISDTTAPVIVLCPTDTVLDAEPGQCGAYVSFLIEADDNCSNVATTVNPPSGSFFAVGSTEVICVAEDIAGNADTCFFDVTVNDTEAPFLNLPDSIVTSNDTGFCYAIVQFEPEATDNCSDITVISTPPSGNTFQVGATSVEVIAEDGFGNADTGCFDIVVNDMECPVLQCPDNIEVFNDSGYYGAFVDFPRFADENCPIVQITSTPLPGTLFDLGTTPVELIAVDLSDNADTCNFEITVLLNDPDMDNLPNWDDNCPNNYNPGQADFDDDGIGDECDLCTDTDSDGAGNPGFPVNTCPEDNCPTIANSFQTDADTDGVGDACDECTDTDGDNYGNPGYTINTCPVDNCPDTANSEQIDTDGDGVGDACCCIGMRGNVNGDTDDNVNVSDVTCLVVYLFNGGDVPSCPAEANINGDTTEEINVSDVTALVAYLFVGGPPPPNCP
ncbi:MAG: HYR domain-containing protein [candidate division Zixibacteria bacterium]|nr:HYR domain-containing protein [candidate division Zixibacteria bacterium]